MLGGYVWAKTRVDKCRRRTGRDHRRISMFDCPWGQYLPRLLPDQRARTSKEFIATGADDDAVAKWIENMDQTSPHRDHQVDNDLRYKRISELPDQLQEFIWKNYYSRKRAREQSSTISLFL